MSEPHKKNHVEPLVWRSPHGRVLPSGIGANGVKTLVMGILNVTPDSFSDGGQFADVAAVVEHAGKLLAAGADVLDIGGESTRPGHAGVSEAEELERVLPVIAALRKAFGDVPLSIDTRKAAVAEAAIRAGADIVNDVNGAMSDTDAATWRAWREFARDAGGAEADKATPAISPMARVMAAAACPVILMHNRVHGASYGDFWKDVLLDLRASVAMVQAAGVTAEQIWLDPGFGFAKSHAENLEVVRNLKRIVGLGFPVLLATSRKSTIGHILGEPIPLRRDAGTAVTHVWGIQQGARMLRVHDVAKAQETVRMADALRAGLGYGI